MRVWFILFFFLACDNTPEHELTTQWRLKDKLKDCDEYSVRLQDMREEPNYQHKYQIRCGKKESEVTIFNKSETDWITVDPATYEKNKWDLDRNILTRNAAGQVSDVAAPPAYQYVGDKRYGEWKPDDQGNMQWIFLPLFLNSFSSPPPPIYQRDYDDYKDSRKRGQTYYRDDYYDKVRDKYKQPENNFYKKLEDLKKRKVEKEQSSKAEQAPKTGPPSFEEKLNNYKKGVIDNKTNISGYGNKTSKANIKKTEPNSNNFKEKLNSYKSGNLQNKTNISGYGNKTSKRNLQESKPKIKKKPTFRERLKKKTSSFKAKVKKKAARIRSKFKKKK